MSSKNDLLAIAIPTYNRANILRENIYLMLEQIKKFSIPIYICDDSDNDLTSNLVLEINQQYPYIYYTKNQPSLGHDKNCIRTLLYPSEKYIWYLADAMIIKKGALERILTCIENTKADFISVNIIGRELDIDNKVYTDGNVLLEQLGWHLTKSGATIYCKKMLSEINKMDISLYPNFPQTAIIFECFAHWSNCVLVWENEKLLYSNIKAKSYWEKTVFKVFLTDWTYCINNLNDQFSENSKQMAIISHSLKTGLFSFKAFVNYRYKGFFGIKEYFQYAPLLKKHSRVNHLILLTLTLIPRFIFSIFHFIFFIGQKNNAQ